MISENRGLSEVRCSIETLKRRESRGYVIFTFRNDIKVKLNGNVG